MELRYSHFLSTVPSHDETAASLLGIAELALLPAKELDMLGAAPVEEADVEIHLGSAVEEVSDGLAVVLALDCLLGYF